jgi:Fe-S-cluster-containing hydrogenase component 2
MQICAWEHVGENNPKRSRIWVESTWPEEPDIFVCRACESRECIASCPTQALKWVGWVEMDTELCTACGMCEESCPVGGIRLDPVIHIPLVCDTCKGNYHCVQWCPTQAIERP